MPINLVWIYGAVVCLYSVEGFIVTVFGPYLEGQGLDHGAIGTIIAIFAVMSLLSRVPAGMIYNKSTVRWIMTVSLVIMAVSTFTYPHTADPLFLSMLRVTHGLSFGVATTLNMALFFEIRPESFSRGRAMGIFAAVLAVGKMIGRLTSGVVADQWGFAASFGVASLFPLIAILFTWLIIIEARPAAKQAGATVGGPASPERAGMPAGLAGLRARLQNGTRSLAYLGDPLILVSAIMAFSLNFLHTMFDGFFPMYGVAVGLSLSVVGLYGGLNNFIGIFSRLLTGELGRFFPPILLTHFGIALSGLLLFALPFAANPYVLLAIVMGLAAGRAIVTVTAAVEVMKVGGGREGMASGIFNAGKDLGNIAGPAMAGWVSSWFGLADMFKIVPISLLVFYAITMLLVQSRMKRSGQRIHQSA